MTEWTLLKRLLDSVHQHSTMIGRLWLTVMVVFRLLIVAVATEDVYADEQEMFACNTLQPGCPTVCYDAFAPISQPRFWVFHIISVSTPSLCFIVYTWHSLSKLPHSAPRGPGGGGAGATGGQEAYDLSCDSDSCSVRAHKHLGHSLADVLEGLSLQRRDPGDPGDPVSHARPPAGRGGAGEGVLSRCYVLHVCLRAVLEVGFIVGQWVLFGFRVPAHFLCTSAPCGQPVDCYVSRPTEKTVFLLFMFSVGVFCILLSLLELNHLGWKGLRRGARRRREAAPRPSPGAAARYETFSPPPDSASLASSSLAGATPLPTLDLVVGHRPDWAFDGGCGPLKEPALGPLGRQDSQRGDKQPLRAPQDSRGSRQRGAEVWI